MIYLFAFLLRGRVVWLRASSGTVYKSIAYPGGFGEAWARVYWFTATGHCILQEGGVVDPCSESNYVKEWKYA